MLALTSRSVLLRVQREEKMRELARLSLAHFVRYRYHAQKKLIVWNWHLDYLCEILEAVTRRELRRTIINIPPRHLKSEVCGQAWPAWMIGRDDSPRSSMVSASYGADLALGDSAKTRGLLRADWYRGIFGNVAMGDLDTQKEWWTAKGATRVAAGTGGVVTGKGGDHLLADDLLKPEESNSELVREKANSWLGETFYSRFNDRNTGTLTVLAQRLHERDPCGYLLGLMKNPQADQFYHINLPLENIDGKPKVFSYGGFRYLRKADELLQPSRINAREVAAMKVVMRANFEGQYNQRPQKMEGGMLRPALLVRLKKDPISIARDLGLRLNIYIDLATKEKQTQKDDPDWSVIGVMGRDQMQRKHLLHLWRAQASMDVVARALLAIYDTYKKAGLPIRFVKGEKIGLQHAFRAVMTSTCRLLHRGILPLHDMSVSADITQRLMPLEGTLNASQLVVPEDATWLPDYEAEMRSVPRGSHDDQMVMTSYGCNDLEESPPGEAPAHHPDIPDDMVTGDMLLRARKRAELIRNGQEADDSDR